MNIARTATAAVLATAGLAAGLPGVAHAQAGDNSVRITVVNDSSWDFSRTRYRVTEGGWDTRPFDAIEANSSDWFQTVSDEDGGGTAGNITFKTANGGQFTITWSNPVDSPNVFSCDTSSRLSCDQDIIDNSSTAEVTFTIG
ncbi:hypothetical protein [Actinoplanes sp. HUAS TT8]|uniref:hypothetical protein n=1 Tax=Actinoplanes sp. HUAS TT8 TaxID=3447453 RepID=UPI003F524C5C